MDKSTIKIHVYFYLYRGLSSCAEGSCPRAEGSRRPSFARYRALGGDLYSAAGPVRWELQHVLGYSLEAGRLVVKAKDRHLGAVVVKAVCNNCHAGGGLGC